MYGQLALDRLESQIKRAASQLNRLTREAVERDGMDSLITKTRLFTPDQEESLHATLSATIATGDLLARSVIARRADQARRRHRVTLYSEIPFKSYVPDDLKLFSPKRALEYFTKLVPSLTLPADWEQEIERSAFTAVAATSQDVLERIRDIIIGGLTRGEMDGPQTIRQVLEAAGMLPENPQYCFLPGTQIEGMITAASKARYDGPAVKIKTNDGRELAVTVNHPVLTTAGWKAAGMIQEGEYLVCYGNPVESLSAGGFSDDRRKWPKSIVNGSHISEFSFMGSPTNRRAIHNQKMPASVEDVFEAFLVEGSPSNDIERPVRPLDFHGDAAFFQGQVNCVRAYGMLNDVVYSHSSQPASQLCLMQRNDISTVSPCMRCGLLNLRRHGLAVPTLRRSKRVKDSFSLFGGVRFPYTFREFGTTSAIDPSRFHAVQKTAAGDMKLVSNLLSAFPGLISTNRVSEVKRISWSGHVYDFQSVHGYVVSQGILSSNSEMLYRTNVMDAHSVGHDREMQDPEMRELFPAWLYSATIDEGSRPWHARKNDRMYEQRVPFVLVRGITARNVVNCRCMPIDLDKWEVSDRLLAGERLYTGVEP